MYTCESGWVFITSKNRSALILANHFKSNHKCFYINIYQICLYIKHNYYVELEIKFITDISINEIY